MAETYGEDLAFIHHEGFSSGGAAAAHEIVSALRKAGRAGGLVVDLGCGSGEFLREVTAAGFHGLGIDQSSAFLRLARRTAPAARFLLAPVRSAPIPPCDAVTAIGEVLNYAGESARKAPPLLPLFRRVARALPAGGLFLFDLIMPARTPSLTARGWRAGKDWAVLTDAREDQKARRITRDIITFRATGKGWRRSEERHVQFLYPQADVIAALREAGFSVSVVDRYGETALLPRRRAFRGIKKG